MRLGSSSSSSIESFAANLQLQTRGGKRGQDAVTGFEVSVGAGSISSAGGEAVLLATGTSAMGAAAVWLSVEVMAMASRVGLWLSDE